MTGGVRNVFVRNCTIGSPNLYFGLYIKTNSVRGGFAENIYLRDLEISEPHQGSCPCNFHRGEGDAGPLTPIVRNVELRDVNVGHARNALMLRGYRALTDPGLPPDQLHLHRRLRRAPSSTPALTFDNVTVNGHPITDTHQLR